MNQRLRARQRLSVRPDRIDLRGDALVTEHALHAPGLLPGERAQVVVEHAGREAWARLEHLDEPHAARRPPPCRHQGRCSGCPLMIAAPSAQADFKRAMLRDAFGIDVDRVVQLPTAELGYRWSAKRVVGGRRGRIVLGSWMRKSHELASMHDCLVDHPDIASCAREIEQAASRLGIEPFDERNQTGELRYVWLKTDGRGAVLVTLVIARQGGRARELAEAIASAAGVAVSLQPAEGNAMRGGEAVLLVGEGTLTLELAGERVVVGPLGFLQPNPPVAALAYRDLVAEARGRLAFDLYAGAGITTALLARRFERVLACELDPEAAALLGIVPERAEDFLAARRDEKPELCIANPPRAGLGAETCALLGEIAPPELRIMSCHPGALARDLARLEEAGFVLERARAYDTLPQTAHLEVIAWLRKRGSA